MFVVESVLLQMMCVCVCDLHVCYVDDEVTEAGAIEEDKGAIRTEAYSLPEQFMWDDVDLQDEHQVCNNHICMATCSTYKD